jgi:hypothetical protein
LKAEDTLGNDVEPLILDLLEWIDREPRTYSEVIEAWRTSCPRLTVWEDCIDRGLATRVNARGRQVSVELTGAGRALLREHGRNNGAGHPRPRPALAGRGQE